MMGGLVRLILIVCASGYVSLAQAQVWDATLLQPQSGDRFGARETVRIQLPASATAAQLEWLALELDNVDVSQLVTLEQSAVGYVVAFTPPQPLRSGEHTLRLVEYTPAGQIIHRGTWTFLSGDVEAIGKVAFTADTTVDVARRVSDDELVDPLERNQLNGGTVFAATGASKNWDFAGRFDLLYDSAEFQTENGGGHSIEIGEYLFEGRGDTLQALLGHHALSYDSLVMREFNRRGASLSASNEPGSANASIFAFRTEPVFGWRNGLGISNEEHRVAGAVVSANPLSQNKQALTLMATCLTGQGEDGTGIGLAGDFNTSEGDACSVMAESVLGKEKVRLRGEYASSDFDFDGTGDDFDREPGNAWDVLAVYAPLPGSGSGEQAVAWSLGAQLQQVDLYFRSLANATLPSDRDLKRVFTTLQWGGLSLQAQAGVIDDNVADDSNLPTLRNRIGNLAATYTPAIPTDEQGLPVQRWYGQPTLSFTSQYARFNHASLPVEQADYRIKQKTLYNQVTAAFLYPNWNWQAGYGLGSETDEIATTFDRDNRLINLAFYWQFSDRLVFGLQGQKNRAEDNVNAIETDSEQVGVNADAVLVRDKLRLTLGLSLAQDEASDRSIDSRSETLSGNLDWQVKQPRANRPGVALWLRGEWQDQEDRINPALATSPYQVFAGIRVDWSLVYPGAR